MVTRRRRDDAGRRESCATCVYGQSRTQSYGPGLTCHRWPPALTAANLASGEPAWPRVKVDDWCGEWSGTSKALQS